MPSSRRFPAMAAMPRNQDNDREVMAVCRVCGGVDGLYLQHGMVADTCVYCYDCYDASNAAEHPKPIMKKPAQAKAAKAKAASAKTATPRKAPMNGIAAAMKAMLAVRVMPHKKGLYESSGDASEMRRRDSLTTCASSTIKDRSAGN